MHPFLCRLYMPIVTNLCRSIMGNEGPNPDARQVAIRPAFHTLQVFKAGKFGIESDRIRQCRGPADTPDAPDFIFIPFPEFFDRPDVFPPCRPVVDQPYGIPDFVHWLVKGPKGGEVVFSHLAKIRKRDSEKAR